MDEFIVHYKQFRDLETWHFAQFSKRARNATNNLHELGYELVKLGDVATVIRGRATVNRSLENGIPLITARNIAENDFEYLAHSAFISIEEHNSMSKSAVEHEDVLLNLYVSTLSNIAAVYDSTTPANIPSNIARVITDQRKLFPQYLAEYFNSSLGKAILVQYAVGSTRAALTIRTLTEAVLVPLPPLDKQRSIIAKSIELRQEAQRIQQEADKLIDQSNDIFNIE